MSRQTAGSKDPDIRASEKALRRAAQRARNIGVQTGTPVYVVQDGQIIDLTRPKRIHAKMK
jgi:protein-disulfide isomerase